jgi:hypothetical protein
MGEHAESRQIVKNWSGDKLNLSSSQTSGGSVPSCGGLFFGLQSLEEIGRHACGSDKQTAAEELGRFED